MALRQLGRKLSTTTAGKLPILYNSTTTSSSDDTVTLQLLSWGRGSSGQLGNGKEDSQELYPSPFSSLILSPNSFCLNSNSNSNGDQLEIGIASGLFHSGLVIDGKLWIWGKGDGGRLGFGHENTVFHPTLNSNVESVKSIALGGLHSIALDSLGHLFSWSVLFNIT